VFDAAGARIAYREKPNPFRRGARPLYNRRFITHVRPTGRLSRTLVERSAHGDRVRVRENESKRG